ncbi:MAG: hypothetical protein ACOC1L_03030 [Bacillota bacterium]
MTNKILRTKSLILKGRFQNHVSKSLKRFEKMPSDDQLIIGEETYFPYYDSIRDQVVFARIEGQKIHALYVSNADYNFGLDDAFEWFNA